MSTGIPSPTDIPSQIGTELHELAPNAHLHVFEFVRSLKPIGSGMSVDTLKKHIGGISADEGQVMRDAIEAGCEQVRISR